MSLFKGLKDVLFVESATSPTPWLSKLYNFFITSEIISILIYILGKSMIHGFAAIYGQGQPGHVSPGAWTLGLPFTFLGAFGIVALKILGIALCLVALIKKHLVKYFILATAALFVLTGWNGARGVVGYIFNHF